MVKLIINTLVTKRLISSFLTIVIFVTSIMFISPLKAEAYNYTVVNTGITQSYVTALGTNLLVGKTATMRDGNNNIIFSFDRGSAANLTDGVVFKDTHIGIYGVPSITCTYDMEQTIIINKMLVVGYYSSGADYGNETYELYVSNTLNELYNSSNKVIYYDNPADLWKSDVRGSGAAQVFTVDDAPMGRYFGIKILDPNPTENNVRMDELGVYGTPYYTTINTGINQTYVDSLGTNILAGKTSTIREGNNNLITLFDGGTTDNLTDGKVFRDTHIGIYGAPSITCTYDMEQVIICEKMLVVGYYNGGKDYGNETYEIYVSNSKTDLYNSSNRVIYYDNPSDLWKSNVLGSGAAQIFTFDKKPIGRYFGIKILDPNPTDGDVRMDELGVYGAPNRTVINSGITQPYVSSLGTNLLTGITPVIKEESGANPTINGTVDKLTDGVIFQNKVDISGNTLNMTITYDMKVDVTCEKLLVTGFYSSLYDYGIKNYELYISISDGNLYDSSNRVLSYDNTGVWNSNIQFSGTVQLFSFNQNPTGRYFGIKILAPNPTDSTLRLDELGVYGTPNYSVTSSGINQESVTGLGTNFLVGKTPIIKDGTGVNSGLDGSVTRLTDGVILQNQHIGIYSTGNLNGPNTTITYDIGQTVICDKFFLAGFYSSSYDYGIRNYEIYMSNSSVNLYDLSNRVLGYNNTGMWNSNIQNSGAAQAFSFNVNPTGRYFGIKILDTNATDDCIRLDELGVYSVANTITVDPNIVINSDFLGLGANTIPTILMPASTVQGYNDAYWELDKKRISEIKLPFVRLWFQIDWMEPLTKGVYDFNSERMLALYKYIDVLKSSGTEIELNFGMKVGVNIQDWFNIDGAIDPKAAAPADLDAFAASCSACLNQLINVKGYTNIKYLSFYNEPDGSDFSCPEGTDKKAYYASMVQKIDAKLKADGRRSLVKIWGPEDNSNDTQWFSYMKNNVGYCFDGYSYHDYSNTYDTLKANIKSRLDSVATKPVYMTEFGFGGENISGWNYSYTNSVIESANNGLSGSAVWLLHGGYLEDPSWSACFNGGYNLWDSVNVTTAPRQSYYEVSMLTRYIPAHSSVISATTTNAGIRSTAFKTSTGDYTVVVECNSGNSNNLNINFCANIGKTFTKHVVKKDMTIEANTLIPVSNGTFNVATSLNDTNISSDYSVIVYTTLQSQTQVEVTPVTTNVQADTTLQLNAIVIDNTGGVTWSIASGEGTVSSTGLFKSSSNAVIGSMVAVKATSVNDRTASGIVLITIVADPPVSFGNHILSDNTITNIRVGSTKEEFMIGVSVRSDTTLVFKNLTTENKIKTGSIIEVSTSGLPNEIYSLVIYGDVDGNGAIDLADLVLVKDYLLETTQLTGDCLKAGDIYGEQKITLNVLVGLMAYISENGIINQNRSLK